MILGKLLLVGGQWHVALDRQLGRQAVGSAPARGITRMDTPDEIRAWARAQAAQLPPFTPDQARQLARSVRAVDTRLTEADPACHVPSGGDDEPPAA